MALGKQIRRYRAALGLTLEQLEARTGVGVGTIAALEGRDSERSKYAARLAAGLGLSLEQLLDESAQYPPDIVLADAGGGDAPPVDVGAGDDLRSLIDHARRMRAIECCVLLFSLAFAVYGAATVLL